MNSLAVSMARVESTSNRDLKSMRAHGWVRNRSDIDKIANQYKEFDKRFLFLKIMISITCNNRNFISKY